MTETTTAPPRVRVRDRKEIMKRYRRLVAHLICESLGYFTPGCAAGAIEAHLRGVGFFCEYYGDWASKALKHGQADFAGLTYHEAIARVGRLSLEKAFRHRHTHRGFMASYPRARALVDHENAGGEGPTFASWF